jgi:hypothetical protein
LFQELCFLCFLLFNPIVVAANGRAVFLAVIYSVKYAHSSRSGDSGLRRFKVVAYHRMMLDGTECWIPHAQIRANLRDRVEPDGLRAADCAVGAELLVGGRLQRTHCD